MRRLLLIAALACSPSWASIALVAHTVASAHGVATSPAKNMTGANLIAIFVTEYSNDPTAGTMSDSSGNTWTHLNLYYSPSANRHITLFYSLNPTVSSSQTFSFTNGGDFNTIWVSGWSGVATSSAFDHQNGAAASTLVTTLQTGSITPSANGALVLAGIINDNASTASIDSGFTVMDYNTGDTYVVGLAHAYLIQSTAAAVNPTWTANISDYSAAMIVSFLPGGGVAAKTCTISLLGAGPC